MIRKPNLKRKKYKAPKAIMMDIAEKTGFTLRYVEAIAQGCSHNKEIEELLAPYEIQITVNPKTLERLSKLQKQRSEANGYGLGRGGRPRKNKTETENS